MKLVIDIPEERYKDIQRIASVQLENCHFKTAEQIIANGTPLPKCHGRLIDADAFTEVLSELYLDGDNAGNFRGTDEETFIGKFQAIDELFNMPTIIEADKVESEDKA